MTSDLTLLLVSVGAALVAGLVLGALLGFMLRRGTVRAAPKVAPPGGDEILRIDGDPAARKLVLRVAGSPVAGADSIADPEVREHVRALLRLLDIAPENAAPASDKPAAPVTGAAARPPAAPAAPLINPRIAPASAELPAQGPVVPTPRPDVPPAVAPAAPDDLSAPFLTRLTASFRPQPAPELLKPAPAPPVRALKGMPAAKPPPDMFEQINAILQRKLAGQPGAPDIELFGADGELRIQVGREVFRQVEDVNDERARGWIREAVAEWEAG